MNSKIYGIVNGKWIIGENAITKYLFAKTDVIGNKFLKDGDLVLFTANKIRAVEIEKVEIDDRKSSFIQTVPLENTDANNAKSGGFEFISEKEQKRQIKRNLISTIYKSNIRNFGITSIILPLFVCAGVYFFIEEIMQIVASIFAQIDLHNKTINLNATILIVLLVIMLSHIIPLNLAFQNFTFASKSNSILKQNINFNMFFVLTFLAVIGCGYYFGFKNMLNSIEIVGGIAMLLLLTYFYKFKMFCKASQISGVWIFFIAILIEFICVSALVVMGVLNLFTEFQNLAFYGIGISMILYILSYLMISKIKDDSKNIFNVR